MAYLPTKCTIAHITNKFHLPTTALMNFEPELLRLTRIFASVVGRLTDHIYIPYADPLLAARLELYSESVTDLRKNQKALLTDFVRIATEACESIVQRAEANNRLFANEMDAFCNQNWTLKDTGFEDFTVRRMQSAVFDRIAELEKLRDRTQTERHNQTLEVFHSNFKCECRREYYDEIADQCSSQRTAEEPRLIEREVRELPPIEHTKGRARNPEWSDPNVDEMLITINELKSELCEQKQLNEKLQTEMEDKRLIYERKVISKTKFTRPSVLSKSYFDKSGNDNDPVLIRKNGNIIAYCESQ